MRLAGVGLDLLNLSRARQFVKTHSQSRLARLFSPAEQKYFRKKIPALTFAKLFTAKEAFFKTLGRPGMGIEGFASMETQLLPRGRFRIRHLKGEETAEGCFFSFSGHVGAQVLRWTSRQNK